MRLWPFGKDDDAEVDYCSRVVTAQTTDGASVRGKLTIHFASPIPQKDADETADAAATTLRTMMEAVDSSEVLGQEAELAQAVLPTVGMLRPIRTLEIVALHIVGGAASEPPPPMTRRPPSVPPMTGRRQSSTQLMAVRDVRLVQPGANPESAGGGLVPLMRDAGTRVLVGVLRSYDLVVVREVQLDEQAAQNLGDMVPTSTAAPGQFADDRAPEIERWQDKLGDETVEALRAESVACVSFFLQRCLELEPVDAPVAARVLQAGVDLAWSDLSPLGELPRYGAASGNPTEVLAIRVLEIAKAEPRHAASLVTALTPVLASVQEDFTFAAHQVRMAGVKA
jgi:hypothetical protein